MSHSHSVKTLSELSLGDIPEAGSKACRLAELGRHGLPVPRGVVVTASAYRAFLGANDLGAKLSAVGRDGLGEFHSAVDDAPVSAELAGEIAFALKAAGLDQEPLAVRSSSPGEDGAYRSRAGVYESQLNVRGQGEVLKALKACWSSLWTERSLAYAGGVGGGVGVGAVAGEAMAVLIQEMVPCDVSGILFTLNPLTADETEMLAEATWGLAAELASGEVSPDRFVIDFWDGAIRRSEAGRKTGALAPSAGGGLERRGLGDAKAGRPCLDRGQLAELARLGRLAQEAFGCPQDIEFGFVNGKAFVLQARPITAYSFPPETDQWTTANFREVMPGFASVLGQSQSFWHDFSLAQQELFHRLRLWRPSADEGTVWSKTIFGHGYWNAGATKRVAARIPGYNERSMDRTVGIEPAYEGDGQVTPWNLKTIAGAIPVLLALGKQYAKVPEEAKAFIDSFEREEPGWDRVDPRDLDDRTLAERVRWGLELHWQANRWALITSMLSTQAQEDFHRMLTGLGRKLGAACPNEARLLTGLTGMATARPLFDLWELSRELARRPGVVEAFRRTTTAELAELLAPVGAATEADAWRAVAGWLRRYRHMSNIDEDLSVPRWSEDPSVPLSMLRGFVLGAAGGEGQTADRREAAESAPAAQLERQRRIREEEEAKARFIGRRWLSLGLDPFWWGRFAKQYRLVKSLCWWREETRVYLSKARYHCRRFLVEQSRRWAKAGPGAGVGLPSKVGRVLGEDDIFWLTRDEVLELTSPEGAGSAAGEATSASGGAASAAIEDRFAVAREMIRRRKSMAILYRDFRVPPNIGPGSFGADGLPLKAHQGLVADRLPAEQVGSRDRADAPTSNGAAETGTTYAGVGCSAGYVTAPCRVVGRIEEAAALQSGEILVAPYANPAWTPLFHLAAGLVLEEGGLLSHSAVVAREYGVPAVLQVKGATTVLRTGDVLTIDGTRGTVTRTRKRP